MPVRDGSLTLADGRRLAWRRYGEPGGLPILYLHGFLGSRLEPAAAGELAADLIVFERPGYGESDPHPAPSLLAIARDLREGLDRLGIREFAVVGVSAGAPHALAMAHLAPERVQAAALVGGVGDAATIRSAGGRAALLRHLDRTARAIRPGLGLARRLLLIEALGLGGLRLFSPELRRCLGSEARFREVTRRLHLSLQRSLAPGLAGVEADLAVLAAPWGFDPAKVTVPTALFHGRRDLIVPLGHLEFYRRTLPRVRAVEISDDEHVSVVVNNRDRIVAAVTRAGGEPRRS
ncbi:MAG TPA: alpha/beta hydrolase [Geminicoccaceae bacterium]|nr:alpha/beta hydrolase [Geminicoccaceae bacterium]